MGCLGALLSGTVLVAAWRTLELTRYILLQVCLALASLLRCFCCCHGTSLAIYRVRVHCESPVAITCGEGRKAETLYS